MYKCVVQEVMANKQTNDICRIITGGRSHRTISRLKAISQRMASLLPKARHRIMVLIDAATVVKYAPEAEFILLEGAPLTEFDCKFALKNRSLILMYRISKVRREDAFFVSGRRSHNPLYDVFILDEKSNTFIGVVTMFTYADGFYPCASANFNPLIMREVEREIMAECLAQNTFVVVNWLLMMKKIKHEEKIASTHAAVSLSSDAGPSARTDAPIEKLAKPVNESSLGECDTNSPDNTIVIDDDGNIEIHGKKFLRLTTFWLVCKHERVVNGRTFQVKAHLRGPNRDCDAAKAALANYLESGHDRIYSVT